MRSKSQAKMRELEVKTEEETEPQGTSDEDGDTCDNEEIENLFVNSRSIFEQTVAPNKYILQIAATLESNPNVGVTLSDKTCEMFNFSNGQFAKLTTLTEHTDVISEIKFHNENSNLIYTASNDGCVKLWDLRTPNKSVAQFTDSRSQNCKQISCFDVSPNNILLAAGTNLFDGDAFILFWDVRNYSLQGAYWESHTDDITQVKFHHEDSNKLISGSVDGLINLYDLSESQETDALIDTLNTDSSVERLRWIQQQGEDIISCITHTADVQFWRVEDAQPYYHLRRNDIAYEIKRMSSDYIYVVDVYAKSNQMFILAGSHKNSCYRGLSVVGNTVRPAWGFSRNQQLVRASAFNPHTNLLFTGGEKGILNAWEVNSPEISLKKKKR